MYGDLDGDTFAHMDGLVSGNSNVDPALLRQFTDNPRESSQERVSFHEGIMRLPRGRPTDTPTQIIEKHILALKIRLFDL